MISKYIFGIWILVTLLESSLGFLVKTKPPVKPIEKMIKPFREMMVGIAEEPSYEEGRTVVKMKSLDGLAKVADRLGKPILSREISPEAPEEKRIRIFYVLDSVVRYEWIVTGSEEEAKHNRTEQASESSKE